MSRENTVKVSLHFGQERAIFLPLFWYICSSALQIALSRRLLTARRAAAFYLRIFSPGTKEGADGHECESQADLVVGHLAGSGHHRHNGELRRQFPSGPGAGNVAEPAADCAHYGAEHPATR